MSSLKYLIKLTWGSSRTGKGRDCFRVRPWPQPFGVCGGWGGMRNRGSFPTPKPQSPNQSRSSGPCAPSSVEQQSGAQDAAIVWAFFFFFLFYSFMPLEAPNWGRPFSHCKERHSLSIKEILTFEEHEEALKTPLKDNPIVENKHAEPSKWLQTKRTEWEKYHLTLHDVSMYSCRNTRSAGRTP